MIIIIIVIIIVIINFRVLDDDARLLHDVVHLRLDELQEHAYYIYIYIYICIHILYNIYRERQTEIERDR